VEFVAAEGEEQPKVPAHTAMSEVEEDMKLARYGDGNGNVFRILKVEAAPAEQYIDMNAHQNEPEQEETGSVAASSERVFYRDAAEFNKAMSDAAESIRTTGGPDIAGNVIWWGLIAILAFLYLADWVFGWDLRHNLIPGIDLVKPVWMVVVVMMIWYFAWTRSQQPQILRNRLCLKCGTALIDKPVDEDGSGVCSKCGRGYNLGEYQRPDENRGRNFHGYIDAAHFDKAIFSAAEQIKKTRRLGFESDMMGCCWIALAVSFGISVLFDWELFDWIPGDIPVHLIWFVTLLLWGWWYTARVRKLKPAIVDQRLCMNCGYCLLGTPIDEMNMGRCPECGCVFASAQYDRPPEDRSEKV